MLNFAEQCSLLDRCSGHMGIQERKEREKEELREKVIAAATRLFQETDYASVSMRKIAKEVEYSVGTLYLYYKDKGELFLAVQEEAFKTAFAYIVQLPEAGDSLERLRRMGERYIHFGLHNPDLYRLMFMMDNPMHALVHSDEWQSGIKLHELLSKLVQDCIDDGHFKGVDTATMSFALWSFVHGMVSLKISCRLDIYTGKHLKDCLPIEDTEAMIQATHEAFMQMIIRAGV